MWFLLLFLQISATQGLNVTLRASTSPCQGRLEVYNSNREWGLVCHYGWKKENGEVVCRSLGCGDHVHSGIEEVRYKDQPRPELYFMDQVQCRSDGESLWKCPFVEPKDPKKCKGDSFVAVDCSGNVTLRLNLNGQTDKCAGAVEFQTHNSIIGVCNSNWDKPKADMVCKELGCGDHYYIPKAGIFKTEQIKKNVQLNCVGNEKYSWQCMEPAADCKDRANVICSKHRRFRLRGGNNVCSGSVEEYNFPKKSWDPLKQKDVNPDYICTQLNCGSTGNFTNDNGTNILTCSDNVRLGNFTSKCFGDVYVVVNGAEYGVCYPDWSQDLLRQLGKVVCRELGCGEVMDVKRGSWNTGLLSNVECQGDEESLWHCLAKHEHRSHRCDTTKVTCSGSLDVRLKDGLGQCSGRVEVKWEESWWSIQHDKLTENINMVCKHLGCGSFGTMPEKLFANGNLQTLKQWSLKCKSPSAKLHECFEKTNLPQTQREVMKIMCEEEQLMFFEGDSPCRGRVRITSVDGTEPKGEIRKNVSDICNTMQCGNLLSFEREPNITSVNVTCSGSVNVKLQNPTAERCWGAVEICRGDKCGGVCRETWTSEHSHKICQNLGCGDSVQSESFMTDVKLSVNDYSVHCSKYVQKMSMCNFIPIKDSCTSPAQVICTGSIKARLEDPRDKCAGIVSLFYAGTWTPVCRDGLNRALNNAICKELDCGELADSLDKELELEGIQCPSTAKSVSECDSKTISRKRKCHVGFLTCTGHKRLLLFNKEHACKGPVYMYTQKETLLVSSQGWGKEEGQMLCQYLQCGSYKTHSSISKDDTHASNWWNKTYNCSGKMNMWECERNDQPVQLQQQLHIECDAEPAVRLSENCSGEVLIDNKTVCQRESQWTNDMSNDLCDSLKCGKAIHYWSTSDPTKKSWQLSCNGKETLLGQCSRTEARCQKISVACQSSLSSRLSSTEKCGGKLVIKYDKWHYICGDTKNTEVCGVLNCTNTAQKPVDEKQIARDKNVSIHCPPRYYSFSQCVESSQAISCKPAEIRCEGYIEPQESSSAGLIVGLILAVLVLVVLVFMWINRKRLLLALRNYRNNKEKDIRVNGNEMDSMDDGDLSERKASLLDRDDYEDVDSVEKSGEEDEEDDKSQGSSGTEYDDIEGQANSRSASQTFNNDHLNQPLLPKRPENLLDQDLYEVETEKEDYDDVMSIEATHEENLETTKPEARVYVDLEAGADSDSEAGIGTNRTGKVVTTEVEVHSLAE
ncbi:scavenger receptor cysteine-rich type 1 protein M130 isoform X3 [Danio rerio]